MRLTDADIAALVGRTVLLACGGMRWRARITDAKRGSRRSWASETLIQLEPLAGDGRAWTTLDAMGVILEPQ